MDPTALLCRVEDRRKKLFDNPDWNGIDFLEVADDQLSLCVHFFGHIPKDISLANVRIEGGRRIRGIRATKIEIDSAHDPDLDDCLRITLDKFGDFSTYRLCLVEAVKGAGGKTIWCPMHGLDPRYSCLEFTFKIDCPSDLDCKTAPECPPEPLPAPDINYLAKDYASFRQLIYDRLALIMPDWQERHVPDIGVTLVEVLAYAGDYLSYYQDAVATEAYLGTARKRVSVRRHARLVDYRMHEGNNARAWVTVHTSDDLDPIKPDAIFFITGFSDLKAASGNVVRAADLEGVPSQLYEIFEPLVDDPSRDLEFRAAHSEIRFYTWGDQECCLPKGATRATLLDESAAPRGEVGAPPPQETVKAGGCPDERESQSYLALEVGDVLIFEEVIGPTTGNAADADPAHRHAVRLTKIIPKIDGLLGRRVVEIEWAGEDALPFALCLSAQLPAPDCRLIDNVSVARGNVVLVDHGGRVDEPLGPVGTKTIVGECACEGSVVENTVVPALFRPSLQQGPLTFGAPLPAKASATRLLAQDPRQALPRISLHETDDGTGPDDFAWSARPDLLSSHADDRDFVVEIDDDGYAHLRFGDDSSGRQPAAGTTFQARYRTGNGAAGNVGRETISYLVLRSGTLSAGAIVPRNPMPARGGMAPEPIAEVKLLAPSAFRALRERAIIADDYAELAERNPAIQGAAAELCWMGSWYEARVAVDPAHAEHADAALLKAIDRYLYRYRRLGHDVAVVPAEYVPLAVTLEVCVLPHYARGQVKAELIKVFGAGRLGFFHPDNLTFGEGVYVSHIVAAAMAIDGVETVKVRTLKRLNQDDNSAIDSGVLRLGSFEVAQCDNDPNFPEDGKIDFILRGGR